MRAWSLPRCSHSRPSNREFCRLAKDSVPTLILAWEYANPQDVHSPQSSVCAPHKPDSALTFHFQAGREKRVVSRSLPLDGSRHGEAAEDERDQDVNSLFLPREGRTKQSAQACSNLGIRRKSTQGLPIRLHVGSARGFTRPMSSYTCFVSRNSSIASAPCRRP